jgi:CHAT domain-containing protein
VDQQFEHLTDAQVEHYGEPGSVAGTDQERAPDWDPRNGDQKVEAHLNECPSCRTRVLASMRSRLALLTDAPVHTETSVNVDPSVHAAPRPDCPPEDDLRNLAAGLSPADRASQLAQHAATCDHCGPILRMYTEDFADDLDESLTPDERKVLAKLKSSSLGWQKKLVGDVLSSSSAAASSPSSVPDRRPAFKQPWLRWAWVPATTAACAVVAFFVYTQRETPEKVEKLLAQAYTEQRTMEMRWPGAEWAPMRVTRGPEDSRFSKPAALLKAEGIIGQRPPANPTDIGWLRARAQAEILDRNPEVAIDGLNKALEAQPDSVLIMLDLAIAYNLQAEISDDPRNLEQAIEYLGKALKKDPTNREALFNRALLYEKMKFTDSAIADWETLLKNEKDQRWKNEAQKKLESLRQLKGKQRNAVPPHSANEWNAALNSNDPNASESALETALLEWLPKVNEVSGRGDPALPELLATAAEKLESQHQDKWLTDLLRTRASPHFPAAIAALQDAVLLNSQGKASDAIIPARQAQAHFLRHHNLPGLVRAQLEEVYAYQRSADGSRCLDAARSLLGRIEPSKYAWIQTQLLLDEASCFNILGRLEEAKLDADDALALAKKSGYKILSLRALGIGAALATTRGDNSFAIKRDLDGLQEYWSGQYPIVRAYQFYSDLSFNAESADLWHLAYAADREAVWAISQTQNKQVEAVARYRLAKAAVMIGDSENVTREMGRAESIFAEFKPTESTLVAQIDGIIGVIRAEINSGNHGAASDLLKHVNVPPQFTESRLITRRLNQVRGDIELKLGHLKEAEEAYLAVVSTAESSLTTLKDARDRIIWNQENGPSYRALADIAQRQDDPFAALELWELYRAAAIRRDGSVKYLVSGIHPHQALFDLEMSGVVQRTRREIRGETLISYAFLPTGLGIWVIDDTQFEFTIVNSNAREIQRLARQFTEECSNPQSDLETLRQHGNRLYKLLIAPGSAHLKPGRILTFETDGELDGLPFSALVDDSGKYLVESYAILFSPGLAYRHYLRDPEPIRRTDSALIVGDPVLSEKWRRVLSPLPSANQEATTVAAGFSGPIVLLGKNATVQHVRQELPKTKVFHFAGHALHTRLGPAILLASPGPQNDDILPIADLPAESLQNANLVVLSACGTKTQRTRPESYFRPFISSRVPQVLATLWQIDSAATLMFMDEFYRGLSNESRPVESLMAATKLLHLHRPYSHPYFWAGFVLSGQN